MTWGQKHTGVQGYRCLEDMVFPEIASMAAHIVEVAKGCGKFLQMYLFLQLEVLKDIG